MNIILMGPQGSGKGTQARILMEKFNLFYFESGAYLRRMAEEHPEIKKIMDEGKLVPDEEFTSYLTAFFDSKNIYDNILFDGFPRTIDQYKFLKNWLSDKKVKLDLVLVIEISEAETVKRLEGRRLDPATGKIYNLATDPPPNSVDVSKLVHRDDDKPEAIKVRLDAYKTRTEKLISFIEADSKVVRVNGERPIDEIAKDLEEIVKSLL